MIIRRRIQTSFTSTAINYGYQEISTPTFENAELFIQKSGEEIVDQLYLFRDKGERELVLRPELTAPVIRFYANELYKQPKPIKLFYFGNCFRYERPQKGRFREFWQFGAELIGTNKPEGIAELIAFACDCLSNIDLKKFELRVGNLEILKNILSGWDILPTELPQFFSALDKGDIDSIRIMLEDAGLTNEQIEDFFKFVHDKCSVKVFESRFKSLSEKFPQSQEILEKFKKVIDLIQKFGIKDFNIDLGIARGLDYYTGTVFEIDIETLGAEKQVCGGGVYSLNELFNLRDINCSGFAIGFDRVIIAYNSEELAPPRDGLDVFIVPLSEPGLDKAIELAKELRTAKLKVELDIKGRNMSKNLKFASAKDSRHVIFIGEDELKKGTFLVRDMKSGDQNNIEFSEALKYFIM